MRVSASGKLRTKVSGTRAVLVLLPSWWIDQCLSCGILPGEKRFVDSNRGRHSTWFCGRTCCCRQGVNHGEVKSKFDLVCPTCVTGMRRVIFKAQDQSVPQFVLTFPTSCNIVSRARRERRPSRHTFRCVSAMGLSSPPPLPLLRRPRLQSPPHSVLLLPVPKLTAQSRALCSMLLQSCIVLSRSLNY